MDSKEVNKEHTKPIMPEINDAMAALGRRYPNIVFFAIECKLSDDELKKVLPGLQRTIDQALQ